MRRSRPRESRASVSRCLLDHRDHVELIRGGVESRGGTWADLGSGGGAFTLALAELLGPGATIHSIDRDAVALKEQARVMAARFPDVRVAYQVADFTRFAGTTRPDEAPIGDDSRRAAAPGAAVPVRAGRPDVPAGLDGIVMANSLHFSANHVAVLRPIVELLRPGGSFVLVEYDADQGNQWVPHPLSFRTWERIAPDAGLRDVRLIGRVSSRFLGAIYASRGTRLTGRRACG